MKRIQKKYFFKIHFSLIFYFLILDVANAQILILKNKQNESIAQDVKKLIIKKFLIPQKIVQEKDSADCKVSDEDRQRYDMIICPKKNGELIFPVYKKTILKNSYKSFF